MDTADSPFELPVVIAQSYNLREPVTGRTPSFTQQEVLEAKKLVVDALTQEGIEPFTPALMLVDTQNKESTMVIHAIVDEPHEYEGQESRNRTFYVQDGTIVKVRKGVSKIADNASKQETPGKDSAMVQLNLDRHTFLVQMKNAMPHTPDALNHMGIALHGWEPAAATAYYSCSPVGLNDGTIFHKVELRSLQGDKRSGLLLFLTVGKNSTKITRQELERSLGSFALYEAPRGRSEHEVYVYKQQVGQFRILAEYTQQEPNSVASISFDSIR